MDFNNTQKHSLLSKMGYSGPAEGPAMEAFIQSSPGVAARMGKFTKAMKKRFAEGGQVTGYATGGFVVTSANDNRTGDVMYSVVDSAGKPVAGPSPSKPVMDKIAAVKNAASPKTGTPKTDTPGTDTGTDTATGTWVANGYSKTVVGDKTVKRPLAKNTKNGNVKTGKADETVEAFVARLNTPSTETSTTPTPSPGTTLADVAIQDPTKLLVKPEVETLEADTPGTLLDKATGQIKDTTEADVTTVDSVETATAPKKISAATVSADTVAGDVSKLVKGVTGEQGTVSADSLVTAAQQTESSISGMQAAQGEAYLMTNPVQREIEKGELVSGSAVDSAKVNKLMNSVKAATATPSEKATVQGQLEGLMSQFEGGNTPAWAAGAMRNAQAMLAQRGLGASSMAGQAVIQAAMESALPIAQADASVFAQFEAQNLSNRQQTALFAAQQRAAFLQQDFDQAFQTRVLNAAKISDIANMNFTAEQNIAMENSRAVNTMNLANLDARQGMVMAQAAALSQLDMANLSNRQQAAVQNAQAFLQMDMANLDNRQQAAMFRAQSNVQALFTDQAAVNAARQFNAASENQTNQFFADLSARVSMFNSEQTNAMNQFNTGEVNATERFNAQLEAQRAQFNANSSLIIAQANAMWRQNVVTTNTAAQNEANAEFAKTANNLTAKAMDEIWQKERDIMSYAFTSIENDKSIAANLLVADKQVSLEKWKEATAENTAMWSFITGTASDAIKILFS